MLTHEKLNETSLVSIVQVVRLLVNLIPSDTVTVVFLKVQYERTHNKRVYVSWDCHVYFEAFLVPHVFAYLCERTVCTEVPYYLLTSL